MIRKMQPQDAGGVWDAITRSLGYQSDVDTVRQRIAELADDGHYVSLVWADDAQGHIRGFIHACRYDTLHRTGGWDVISLAVLPEAQGEGIGRALLEALESEVRERGGTYVRLNSRVEREAAHAFYEHVGYTCDKLQKRFIKQLE